MPSRLATTPDLTLELFVSRRHSGSYGHRVLQGSGYWEILWTVDYYYYYYDSRLRFPRRFRRITDAAGAARFKKKWGLS